MKGGIWSWNGASGPSSRCLGTPGRQFRGGGGASGPVTPARWYKTLGTIFFQCVYFITIVTLFYIYCILSLSLYLSNTHTDTLTYIMFTSFFCKRIREDILYIYIWHISFTHFAWQSAFVVANSCLLIGTNTSYIVMHLLCPSLCSTVDHVHCWFAVPNNWPSVCDRYTK